MQHAVFCLPCREVRRYNRQMRRRYNPERIDVPPVVAVLRTAQAALELANRRVMELESVCETLNEQLSESNDRADAAELALLAVGNARRGRSGRTQHARSPARATRFT